MMRQCSRAVFVNPPRADAPPADAPPLLRHPPPLGTAHAAPRRRGRLTHRLARATALARRRSGCRGDERSRRRAPPLPRGGRRCATTSRSPLYFDTSLTPHSMPRFTPRFTPHSFHTSFRTSLHASLHASLASSQVAALLQAVGGVRPRCPTMRSRAARPRPSRRGWCTSSNGSSSTRRSASRRSRRRSPSSSSRSPR
jgi:hypothetical protein